MFGELIGLWTAAVWQQMGAPDNVRADRARPRPRHPDGRRAARRQGRCRRSATRSSLHLVEISPMLQAQQEQTLAALGVPMFWHATLRRRARRAGDHRRQRILRRAAGPPGGQAARRLARAHGRDRRDRQARLRPRARADAAFRATAAAAVRDAPIGAIFEWRADTIGAGTRPARRRRRRRRAGHRLRPCRQARSAKRCRRSAATPIADPLRRARRGRPHRACRFRRRWRAPPRAGRARPRPGRAGRIPAHASASSARGRAARRKRRPTRPPTIDAALARLTGHRPRPAWASCSRCSADRAMPEARARLPGI